MHSCVASGDAPQDIAWGLDMSVENEARPHGPSKVSRRNLIAGAAVAVPAAAVLNASSAWAKPLVNSLIGMPALVASKSYLFNELFRFTPGTGTVHPNEKSIAVSGVAFTGITTETVTVVVTPQVSGCNVSPTTVTFSVVGKTTQTFGFTITKIGGGKFTPGTVLAVLLGVTVTGAHAVSSPPGFDVTA